MLSDLISPLISMCTPMVAFLQVSGQTCELKGRRIKVVGVSIKVAFAAILYSDPSYSSGRSRKGAR